MNDTRRNVALLSACQALLFTNNSTTIALNGLAGLALAPVRQWATLPVTMWVIGAALTTFPASLLMSRAGRRTGFLVGAVIGMVGAAVAAAGLIGHSFITLCAGTLVLGTYNAFGQYYRFAAADVAAPEFKAKAISYVMAGGLLGGVLGPTVSRVTVDMLDTRYAGAYLFLIVFMLVAVALLVNLRIPAPRPAGSGDHARPLREIAAQPVFIVAVLSAAIGYGVMNFLMVATPLEMTGVCGHPYSAAAGVISAHVVGMFAPSFVTGSLIARFGVLRVMLIGVVINMICLAIAAAGVSVAHFWWSLTLLGIGWNFLFIGATALLTEAYRPAERAKVQGLNDVCVFMTTMVTSLGSGYLLQESGWTTILLIGFCSIAACGIMLLTFAGRRSVRAGASA